MRSILLILYLFCFSLQAEIYVVTNKDNNSINALNKPFLKDIFFDRRRFSADGKAITPLDQDKKGETYKEFYQKLVNMSQRKLKKYWMKKVFTGQATPPKSVQSDKQVISYILNNMNAVGYIQAEAMSDSLKIIYIIE